MSVVSRGVDGFCYLEESRIGGLRDGCPPVRSRGKALVEDLGDEVPRR